MSKSTRRPPKLSPALFSAAVGAGAPTGGLPPSPSAQNPTEVHDAHVELASPGALVQWKADAGDVYGPKIKSVVLALPANAASKDVLGSLALSSESGVIALSIPYPLSGPPPELTAPVPIAYSFTFKEPSDALVEALKWASDKHPVDVHVQVDLINGEQGWESLEELISKVITTQDSEGNTVPKPNSKPIVLSNMLPPPGALAVPTVKLLAHPMYLAYQARIASLSFSQNVYLKYLPPDWNTPTPTSPLPGAQPADPEGSVRDLDSEAKKEWKRRTKMYLGPAIEAFGYSRLVFGSSPSTSSTSTSNAGDWYQIAKESVAELGVDQEGVDAVFGNNAKTIYGA
ncbi:unnamed protein product [Rhizoctonia solani]|uniref:Uncharacterized protein n=3 Tax=Rhizoctonia solani TaxID=456999 RepID=A0A8H3GLJ1_9AGAM|nr:hypothetical protein RSOL_273900 [Rhizoctonia solani AG-3 Rhs1AP]KEP53274.1 hypothetical protein V565_033250 [Rhizoctonia solani 123E]CAE6452937.1 unnamed protein product [Rhizoctonia solani]CAE6456717.1 unnamed protein product [Rhizoctonia solani]